MQYNSEVQEIHIRPQGADVYVLCHSVCNALRTSPEAVIHATGAGCAIRALRVLVLADAELRRQVGGMEGFGQLALRIDSYHLPLSDVGHTVITAARFVDLPALRIEVAPLVANGSTCPVEFGNRIARQLCDGPWAAGGQPNAAVAVRFVGEAAADRVFQAMSVAHEALRRDNMAATELAVAPVPETVRTCLSTTTRDPSEMTVIICPWAVPAPLLPRRLSCTVHYTELSQHTPVVAAEQGVPNNGTELLLPHSCSSGSSLGNLAADTNGAAALSWGRWSEPRTA